MKVFLSLGSNTGNRKKYLTHAIRDLNDLNDTEVLESSSIYETEPWGNKNLDLFLNQVIIINTELSCVDLLKRCNNIEKRYGRVKKSGKWMSRTLDIDILVCEDKKISTDQLQVPHPWIAERMFILKPLSELDSNLIIPGINKRVKEIIQACDDTARVSLYK